MVDCRDARYRRTHQAICDALAEVLQSQPLSSVDMSQLARRAHVSRNTLYAHFPSVVEVYRELVDRFLGEVQTLDEHFWCHRHQDDENDAPPCPRSNETEPQRMPYCQALRQTGPLSGVVRDPQFAATVRELSGKGALNATAQSLMRAGVPSPLAPAVALFQLSGCQAVATSDLVGDGDWPSIQKALDRFIQAGIAALATPNIPAHEPKKPI